jgi:predicted HTH domain antitoxin
MGVIRIDLPECVLLATGQSEEEFVRVAKLFLALMLFERGRISSGIAAEICGMGRVEFALMAGRLDVPAANLDESEIAREFDRTKDQSRGTT